MKRRGDYQISGWWAFVAFLLAIAAVVLGELAWEWRRFDLMTVCACCGFLAYTTMLAAMPPRWDR